MNHGYHSVGSRTYKIKYDSFLAFELLVMNRSVSSSSVGHSGGNQDGDTSNRYQDAHQTFRQHTQPNHGFPPFLGMRGGVNGVNMHLGEHRIPNYLPFHINSGYMQMPGYVQQPVQQMPSHDTVPQHQSQYEKGKAKEKYTASGKWDEKQAGVLVKLWKEKLKEIESSRSNEAWKFIMTKVNEAGPAQKTAKQCKDKIRNLKDAYKKAKANNKTSGASPEFTPFFDDFDEMLATRDVIELPLVTEVGLEDDVVEEEVQQRAIYDSADDEDSLAPQDNIYPALELETELENENSETVEDTNEAMNKEKRNKSGKRIARKGDGSAKGKNEKKRKKTSDYQEELISVQREQMEQFKASEERHREFMREMMQEQRRQEMEERERDRDFFLQLGRLFAGKRD